LCATEEKYFTPTAIYITATYKVNAFCAAHINHTKGQTGLLKNVHDMKEMPVVNEKHFDNENFSSGKVPLGTYLLLLIALIIDHTTAHS